MNSTTMVHWTSSPNASVRVEGLDPTGETQTINIGYSLTIFCYYGHLVTLRDALDKRIKELEKEASTEVPEECPYVSDPDAIAAALVLGPYVPTLTAEESEERIQQEQRDIARKTLEERGVRIGLYPPEMPF